jgi:hypothetical protein
MVEHSAFEDDSVLQALREEPRKVDGGVDTNRCEAYARVGSRTKLIFGKCAELGI